MPFALAWPLALALPLAWCGFDFLHSRAPWKEAWLESLRAALRRRDGSGSDFSGIEATESVDQLRSMLCESKKATEPSTMRDVACVCLPGR